MRGAILTASLVLLLLGSTRPAVAQSGDHILFYTYTCEFEHDSIGVGFAELPDDCEMAGGVRIVVTDQTGTVVNECTTSAGERPGHCSMAVPLGETITITEDVSTVPEGYSPTRNPIVVDTPPHGAPGEWIKEFINVAGGDTVTLPNTGAGSTERADSFDGVRETAIVAFLLSGAAFLLKRRGISAGNASSRSC